MHALVTDNTIVRTGRVEQAGDLWQIIDGDTITGHASPDEVAALGWLAVTDTPRPEDTADTTHDYAMQVVDGLPTVVWTPRPKTPDELAAETQGKNRLSIEDKIATVDMAAGQAIIDTAALNITGTTVAEVRSSAQAAVRDLQRQVKDLARANRRLSRLLLQLLDGTD